jgi:hypothetical protein
MLVSRCPLGDRQTAVARRFFAALELWMLHFDAE